MMSQIMAGRRRTGGRTDDLGASCLQCFFWSSGQVRRIMQGTKNSLLLELGLSRQQTRSSNRDRREQRRSEKQSDGAWAPTPRHVSHRELGRREGTERDAGLRAVCTRPRRENTWNWHKMHVHHLFFSSLFQFSEKLTKTISSLMNGMWPVNFHLTEWVDV